ncbi:Hpt domain-containing protein [Roseobacter sp.]|uniref:Hpt domain-containing protein n=1 Tax=Roseobacter sp. TaxID=1907202 RepID=UPI003297A7D8
MQKAKGRKNGTLVFVAYKTYTHSAEDSMIDWSRVATLREEIGAEDFDDVVELFLEEVDAAVDELAAQQHDNDLESKLHFLKGSALSLGFQSFSELCQAGEKTAAMNQDTIIDLQEILHCYTQSRTVFVNDLPDKMAG